MGSLRGHGSQFLGRRQGDGWAPARCECAAGEQAAPSLLRPADLGWGLKEPWEMGVGVLSVCGVTDLGPQTADPDAGASSRSGGAATTCGLGAPGWRLCHLRRPCRGASDVGVTSPGSSPSHLSGLSSPGRALISVARFPEGRAGGGGFALPLSRDSLSYICYDGDPGPQQGSRHKGGLNLGPIYERLELAQCWVW